MFNCVLISIPELLDTWCQENKTQPKNPAQVSLLAKAADNEEST